MISVIFMRANRRMSVERWTFLADLGEFFRSAGNPHPPKREELFRPWLDELINMEHVMARQPDWLGPDRAPLQGLVHLRARLSRVAASPGQGDSGGLSESENGSCTACNLQESRVDIDVRGFDRVHLFGDGATRSPAPASAFNCRF